MGSVRSKAAATACKSNLRQIALGVLLYAGDHKNAIPTNLYKGLGSSYASTDSSSLVSCIGPYLGGGDKLTNGAYVPVMECPAHLSEKGGPASAGPPLIQASYMILNGGNSFVNNSGGISMPWGNYYSAQAVKPVVKLTQLPSWTYKSTALPVALRNQPVTAQTLILAADFDYVAEGYVHGKTAMNASYFDGSVRSIDPVTYETK